MPTAVDILAEVPIFHRLSEQDREKLAERIDVEKAVAGTHLFSHGDPGGSLFVVRSGVVELWFKNDTGEHITLETVGPGQFFGEISLLDGGPRTTSALVKEDLEALVIDRGDLEALVAASPDAAMSLLAAAGERQRTTVGLLTMSVSLEAIILSVFVLLSQNRQVARDRVRNDIEYEVNVRAELQIAQMHEKVDNMYAAIMARLDREQAGRAGNGAPRAS